MTENFNLNKIYIFYLFTFLIAPLGFLIRVFYTKTLSIQEFSFIYGVISFFNLIFLFTNFGLSSSLNYYLPKFLIKKNYKNIRNIITYVFIFYFILTLIISYLLYFLKFYLSKYYFHNLNIVPYFTILLLFFIGTNLFTILRDIFISFKLTTYYQLMTFLKFIFILFGSLLLFIFSNDKQNLSIYYAYLWGISTFLILFIFLFIFLKKYIWLFKKLPNWDKKLFFEVFKFGFYIFISDFGVLIISQTDIILITYFLGVINSGIYGTMISLIQFLPIFLSPLAVIMTPLISEFKVKKQINKITSYLNMFYILGFFIIFPFSLVFFVFSDNLIRLFFSNDFLIGLNVLKVFSIFGVFRVISEYNKNIMKGLGLTKFLVTITLFIAIFNIIFDLIFIKLFGIVGAAYITAFVWLLYVLFTTYFISKNLNFKLNSSKFLIIFILSLIFLFSLLFLNSIINISNIYIKGFLIILFSFILYLYLGNYFRIFIFEDLLLFIPKKLRYKFINLKNKYFKFIK